MKKYHYTSLIRKSLQKKKNIFISSDSKSMLPFIKSKDKLETSKKKEILFGDIIAFLRKDKIIVHRVVFKKKNYLLTKGDNSKLFDGYLHKKSVLGVVERINDENVRSSFFIISSKFFAIISLIIGILYLPIKFFRKRLNKKGEKISSNKNLLILLLGNKKITKHQMNNYTKKEIDSFIDLTSYFKLEGIVYKNGKNLLPKIRNKFRKQYELNMIRNMLLLKEAEFLSRIFKKSKIKFILLKGPQILKMHKDLGSKYINDIDFFIDKKNVQTIERIMYEQGYEYYSKVHSKTYQTKVGFHYQYIKFDKIHYVVEIHWHLVPKNSPYKIDNKELWQNTKSMRVGNESVTILNDKFLLSYLSVGFVYPNFFSKSLRFLCDISLLTNYISKKDWTYFMRKCRDWNSEFPAYYTLFYCKKLLNADIPKNVLDKLYSRLSILEILTTSLFNINYLLSRKKITFQKKLFLHTYFKVLSSLK